MRFRMLLRWWLLRYIIGRLVSRLQYRLRLVEQQQLWLRQLRCFWWHQCILNSWIWFKQQHICKFRQQLCMGRWLLIRYLWPLRIWKRSPLNLRCILGFRMRLSNQLIVILRMIISSFRWRYSCILLMNRWLRKPSMIHIVLDFWLG